MKRYRQSRLELSLALHRAINRGRRSIKNLKKKRDTRLSLKINLEKQTAFIAPLK